MRANHPSAFRVMAALAVALAVGSAGAVTKHYSFSSGYPTTTSRQPSSATGATFGSNGSVKAGTAGKAEERSLVGTVVRIDSGDVIWVTPTGGRRTKVKLDRVDAPEQGQNFGVEAKKFLFDLLNGKRVTVRYWEKDRAGTIPGTVFLEREQGLVEVNLTLVKNGCAWAVEPARTVKGTSETARTKAYAAAQKDARDAKRGLWAAPNPVSPSEWRKLHR